MRKLTFVLSAVLSAPVVASGFFPEPIYTTDEFGELGIEALVNVACYYLDTNIDAGKEVPENDIVKISDPNPNVTAVSYYYSQDLVFICQVSRSI